MQSSRKFFYNIKYAVHKLTHWEYWPQVIIDGPIFPLYLFYALKHKAFGFFVTANPHDGEMKSLTEEKKKIYDLIPKQYYPATILVQPQQNFNAFLEEMQQMSISFPLIVKPNQGQKGIGVKKIYSQEELLSHHNYAKHPYLIQQLNNYSNEIGLFYVRFPNDINGRITGIVYKEYLQVTGDGKRTLEELIYSNARTFFQLDNLKDKFKTQWNTIIPLNEVIMLVPFGNHVRGSMFLDYSYKITPKLTETINDVCTQINGYYFGRMDIKFDSWEDLEKGNFFSIIETNGAGSEPTHIYDPKHSIFFGWKEIIRHLYYLQKVCSQNHKRGYKYASSIDVFKMIRHYRKHVNEIY